MSEQKETDPRVQGDDGQQPQRNGRTGRNDLQWEPEFNNGQRVEAQGDQVDPNEPEETEGRLTFHELADLDRQVSFAASSSESGAAAEQYGNAAVAEQDGNAAAAEQDGNAAAAEQAENAAAAGNAGQAPAADDNHPATQ